MMWGDNDDRQGMFIAMLVLMILGMFAAIILGVGVVAFVGWSLWHGGVALGALLL